nr:DUF3977 family protein [Paenibacillus hamazuiensis]
MKYIEIGFGNTWFIRTEIEKENGTEYEVKGIAGPVKFHSMYIRVWVGRTVFIADVRHGLKAGKKNRQALKLVFGVTSY